MGGSLRSHEPPIQHTILIILAFFAGWRYTKRGCKVMFYLKRRGNVAVIPDPPPMYTTDPSPSSEPTRATARGLLQLLDMSPDALVVVDQAGTIAMANQQL